MDFPLHRNQLVSIFPLVRFQHYSSDGYSYKIYLNQRQFKNLDDFVRDIDLFEPLQNYPLGEGVWLQHKNSLISITDNHTSITFKFHPKSWTNYRRSVHPQLISIFDHAEMYHYQSNENYESESNCRPRRGVSYFSGRKQNVSRSARNVTYENGQRAKCSSFSKRNGTNSRSHYRRRGGRDATTTRKEIEEGEDIAKIASDENDDKEYGCERSNGEGDCSPQYQLE